MSRLEKIIGTEIIDDIRLGHTWYEFGVLYLLIDSQLALGNSTTFVEIGVHEGGLSYMLIPKFPELNYFGVEICCELIRPEVKQLYLNAEKATLICSDCYSDLVASVLKGITQKIVYCDGGGKAKELKHFKALCNPGDILASHDYHDGKSELVSIPPENFPDLIEVSPEDIVHMEMDKTFEPIAVPFPGTRIVAWRKL